MSQRVDSADSKRGLPTYDMAVASELPTYEQAQALNNEQKYYQNTEVPESPPPAWSPIHQTNVTAVPSTPEFTQITIHEESNSLNLENSMNSQHSQNLQNLQNPQNSPAIYQIFGMSPNRVQRKYIQGVSKLRHTF